jgi:hypothetical protein
VYFFSDSLWILASIHRERRKTKRKGELYLHIMEQFSKDDIRGGCRRRRNGRCSTNTNTNTNNLFPGKDILQ